MSTLRKVIFDAISSVGPAATAPLPRREGMADFIMAAIRNACHLEPDPDLATKLNPIQPRPLAEYHQDMGSVLWWRFPVTEPPYVGSPLDLGRGVKVTLNWIEGGELLERHMTQDVGGWPGYHTHFTPLPPIPSMPAAEENYVETDPHVLAELDRVHGLDHT